MSNFTAARSGAAAALTLQQARAWGPLICSCALACSVYADPHAGEAPVGVGGSEGSGGSAGESISGGSAGTSSGSSAALGGGGTGGGSGGSGASAGSGAAAGGSAGGAGTAGAAGAAGAAAGTSSAGGAAGSAAGGGGGEAGQLGGGDVTVIDDMEDNDAQVTLSGGRDGFWYVGNDGTLGGTQEPAASAFEMAGLASGDRDGSGYAAHMKVSGYSGWGSVIGFNLIELLGSVKAYDAANYCGVRFWAKAAATTALRVRLPDGDTHPAGGVCVDGGAAGTACYDHFGKNATFGTSWSKFDVRFTELDQAGTGYHPADKKLKPGQLYAIEWALPGANKAYELWIDDVSFLACE